MAGETAARGKSPSPVPFNTSQPVKYINDPTLPSVPAGGHSGEKKISPNKDEIGPNTRAQHQKKELNINTSEVEAAFVPPNTKKNVPITTPTSSTPSYTDRAREFLQFGKILKRSSLPTPRLLPIRRRSSAEVKKGTTGVAIPDDNSVSGSATNNTPNDDEQVEQDVPNFIEKKSPSKNEASLIPIMDSNLSPTEKALQPDYFQSHEVPARGPPLPGRKSLDQAGVTAIIENVNANPSRISRSKSTSGEIDRVNSQETNGSLHDEVSTNSSAFPRLSFFSISGTDANLGGSNIDHDQSPSAQQQHHRNNSFFSRGLSIMMTRSRSTDSNPDKVSTSMKRNTIAGGSVTGGSSITQSPNVFNSSRDSYDLEDPGNTNGTNTTMTNNSVTAMENTVPEEKEKPRRISGIFERSTEGSPSLAFPTMFGFSSTATGSSDKSPGRRESRGLGAGYDASDLAVKTNIEPPTSAKLRALGGTGGMDGSNHSSPSVSSKASDGKNTTGSMKIIRAAITSFLTGNDNGDDEKQDLKDDEENDEIKRRRKSLDQENSEGDDNANENGEDDDDDDYDQNGDDLTAEFDRYPLKSLGPTAMEYINRQQITLIKKMWQHLLQGVPVIKHSRSGKPKSKVLFCDYAMTRLYWRSPGSKPDPRLSVMPSLDEDIRLVSSDYVVSHDQGDDSGGNGRHSEDSAAHGSDSEQQNNFPLQTLSKSSSSQRGKSIVGVRKSIFSAVGFQDSLRRSSFTKSDNDRELYLKDILSISSDGQSDVFRRSAAKNYFQQHEDTSLMTLFLLQRTLDCEIISELFAEIFPALQIIVNFYQIYMTGHLSLSADIREQLTYVSKNGANFATHSFRHHPHSHVNEGGGRMINEEEMDAVMGDHRVNRAHSDPMSAPPNTPQIANNYQYPSRYYSNNDQQQFTLQGQYREEGTHRNSLKSLFPIAENQEEEK